MKNKITTILAILLTCIFFQSCGNKGNKNNNSDGIRIVSLAQSVTNELEDLGLENAIVGATSYCDVSLKNPDLVVGTSTEVNLEKILLLKPDIVLATGLTSQTSITSLKNNGINVHQNMKMQSYKEICTHLKDIGKLVGKEDEANSLVVLSEKKIDSLIKRIPAQTKKQKIFFQIGANPLFTVIPDTYMNDFITLSGCENIASDFTRGTITRESVIQRNPDIIFIVTMGIVGNQEKEIWERYKELNAVKNKKIFVINSEMACNPTVSSFTKSMEEIIKKIYF